jgi:hypothetical protein
METLKEITADVFIFIAAFILSTGACAHKTVTCASGPQVEVSP